MSLEYEPPSDALAAELTEVAEASRELLGSLEGRSNSPLPADFPKNQLSDICRTLTNLPLGTAEGCRAPLEYARNRLPAIRREHVRITSSGDETLTRGTVVDTRLGALIIAVSTALDEYRRAAANEDIAELPPEAGIAPPRQAVEDTLERTKALEQSVHRVKSDFNELSEPTSQHGDNIKRQLEDVDGLNRLGAAEMQMPKVVVGWLKKTTNALKTYPAIIKKSMSHIRVGIDVAQIAYDRWHEFSRNGIHFLFEEVRKTTHAIDKAASILEKSTTKDEAKRTDEPSSLREAAVRILAANGSPMSAKQILEKLKGSEIITKARLPAVKPYKGIYTSLVHRERTIGDVVNVGTGYWALTEWLKKGDVAKLRAARGTPARQSHAERTKQGMEAAKRDGRRLGQPPKLGPEQELKAKQMFKDGETRAAIAAKLGVSMSTIIKVTPWKRRTPKQ